MPGKRLVWHLFPQVLVLLVLGLALIGLISRLVDSMTVWTVLIAPVIVLVALGMSWAVCRPVWEPLKRVKEATQQFATGDYGERLWMSNSQEMAEVAEAFNAMAEKVQASFTSLSRRNHEQEAVLTS